MVATLYRLLGEALACLAFAAVAYIVGAAHGKQAATDSAALKRELAQAAAASAVEASASAIAGIRVENRTIYRKVADGTAKSRVYRDCMHSPDVVRDLEAAFARGRSRAPGAADPGLPLAGSADRLELRRDDGQADRGAGHPARVQDSGGPGQ